jgi:hypothetical protein
MEGGPMSHPALPDPAAVARGAKTIERELKRALILPRADDRNPYALAAGIGVSLVDRYQRALAELGAQQ